MERRMTTPAELPLPLETDVQNHIISKLGTEGDSEARSMLIEHNLRLVAYIAKKFSSTNAETEDLISIGTIGLIKAVNTFDPRKNIKLATYVTRCVENEIILYIRKAKKAQCEISLDEPLSTDADGRELTLLDTLDMGEDEVSQTIEAATDTKLLHEAVGRLNEKERLIVTLRFGFWNGRILSQAEVAAVLGITQSLISRKERAIMKRLRSDLLQVGFNA